MPLTILSARLQRSAFALWACGVLVLFHARIVEWVKLSLQYESYSHLILIPFIVAYLLYVRRSDLYSTICGAVNRPGLLLVMAGTVIYVTASVAHPKMSEIDLLTVNMVAIVTVLIGGHLLLMGPVASRKAIFPLMLLYLAVPLPNFALDRITEALQYGSSELAAWFFDLTGVPFLHHGFDFVLPNFSIEVARECSGIRSSTAMFILALICGYLCLSRPIYRLMLVAVSLPLMIVKNAIRIVTLSLLAEYVNPSFLTGNLHRYGGAVFFGLAMILFSLILNVFRNWELRTVRVATPERLTVTVSHLESV